MDAQGDLNAYFAYTKRHLLASHGTFNHRFLAHTLILRKLAKSLKGSLIMESSRFPVGTIWAISDLIVIPVSTRELMMSPYTTTTTETATLEANK